MKCPRQELNLIYELRGLACESGTLQGQMFQVPRQGVEPRLMASKTIVRPSHSQGRLFSVDKPRLPTAGYRQDVLKTGSLLSTNFQQFLKIRKQSKNRDRHR
ncbi:hypothetical protein [Gimesia sp.]|uniref:hypothetical protein n=1 Tax=Gimesia sp. TaxID=2024833 RepID=UPI003A952CBA